MISEINPKELKTDPRTVKPFENGKAVEEEVSSLQVLTDGMVAYCGSDIEFNNLRVFPPQNLRYPDILRDKDFFEKIGCPHLRLKYPNSAEQ